jgi:hypothetical protein
MRGGGHDQGSQGRQLDEQEIFLALFLLQRTIPNRKEHDD